MTGVEEWSRELRRRDPSDWPAFLDENSRLPGPRGNIELALAFADLADPVLAAELAASDDEYRAFCGTVALGDRASEPAVEARLRALASDPRWRVREAVAMGLQRFGDVHLATLATIVLRWVDDPDPLVQRAAAAAICEPRLLTSPDAAATAVEVCRRATAGIARRPASARRDPAVRTLRQGLGYCWSVAVAADPVSGLRAFRLLDGSDPDVAWIIARNRSKKRLAPLLDG